MASLLYKEGMRGKVALIYMDPPYNQSFRSNFQANAEFPETEEDWDDLPNDPMAIKAFRDNYRDGVHSYLDGLYEQLVLGRELLNEAGSFIVQIGPDNVHEVVMLMGEVFERENHVATIPYRPATNPSTSMLPEVGNWLVWYAKNKEKAKSKYHQLYEELSRQEKVELMTSYGMCELADGTIRNLTQNEKRDVRNVPEGARLFNRIGLASSGVSGTGRSDTFYLHLNGIPCETHDEFWDTHICTSACDETHSTCPLGKQCGQSCTARAFRCPAGNHWRVSLRGMHQLAILARLTTSSSDTVRWKQYEDEIPGRTINAIWLDTPATSDKQYVVETPPKVLERCILMTTDPGDLILDLTCGSGAMPFQAETWGRRWVSVDVAQVSIAIARERLITNTYPYHMLKDSPEGARSRPRHGASTSPSRPASFRIVEQPEEDYRHDPQHGFVVERQTRVSAATLAYGHDDQRPINHEDRTVKVTDRARVASPFTVESDSPYRSVMPGDTEQDQQATDVETMLQTSGFEVRTTSGRPSHPENH